MSRGIPQMILGQRQRKEGEEMQEQYKKDRPEFDKRYKERTKKYRGELDKHGERIVGNYERLAKTGLPEEQKSQFHRNVDRGVATRLAGSNSRRGGMVGLADTQQTATDAYSDMLAQDSAARLKNEYNLAQADATYGMMGTKFSYGREAGAENVELQDLYDFRDRGFATEQAGYENISKGWAQLDSDIMTWMTMGMGGGGGGGMGGGGGGGGDQNSISSGNPQQNNNGNNSNNSNSNKKRNAAKRGSATDNNTFDYNSNMDNTMDGNEYDFYDGGTA